MDTRWARLTIVKSRRSRSLRALEEVLDQKSSEAEARERKLARLRRARFKANLHRISLVEVGTL